jgi:hypothetical protein
MIPDRHDSSEDESSVEGVCIVIFSFFLKKGVREFSFQDELFTKKAKKEKGGLTFPF